MELRGMKAVRHFSLMNPWIDFVVVVPEGFEDQTMAVVKNAMDMFWDFEYETYGDAVECELALADIPFEIRHIPWDSKADVAIDEKDWENWVELVDRTCGLKYA